jgi:hypothetical protein
MEGIQSIKLISEGGRGSAAAGLRNVRLPPNAKASIVRGGESAAPEMLPARCNAKELLQTACKRHC